MNNVFSWMKVSDPSKLLMPQRNIIFFNHNTYSLLSSFRTALVPFAAYVKLMYSLPQRFQKCFTFWMYYHIDNSLFNISSQKYLSIYHQLSEGVRVIKSLGSGKTGRTRKYVMCAVCRNYFDWFFYRSLSQESVVVIALSRYRCRLDNLLVTRPGE